MDMSQYLDVFMEESKEHLTNLNDKVLDLEKKPDDIVAINEIFRAAHTLKGMSSTMGFEDVADLTHHMENVLSDVKEQKLQVNGRVIDVLFQCFDRLQSMIERIEKGDHGRSDNSDLISILDHIKTGVVEEARMQNKEIAVEESDAVEQEVTVSFNEYDMALIKEASIKGFKIIYIKIAVDPTCVMKAVRSFMVFKALEEGGEIIKSIPPAQDLDEGNFDEEFEIVYLTQLQDNEIKQYIEHISEIKIVKFENITLENLLHNKQVKQQNQINQEAKEDESQEPNQKAHIIKKTVRVDIERLDNLMNLVGELVMHKGRLEQIGSAQKMNDLNETIEQIDRISTDLQ
ncbi:MAG: Hpt domain-containing protein, partial [Bacillota bacterium]|nr:Hpt domain-containing protein [Bacillota bacterium]